MYLSINRIYRVLISQKSYGLLSIDAILQSKALKNWIKVKEESKSFFFTVITTLLVFLLFFKIL